MIVDLTEEEIEFLQRMCMRAMAFAQMGIQTNTTDQIKLQDLMKKLVNK